MAEGRVPAPMTEAAQNEHDTSATVLYTAELVYDGGTFTLNLRDLTRGTLRTTTVPRRMVRKIPTYLSMINFR